MILFCSVTQARTLVGLHYVRNPLDPCLFSKLPMPAWNKVLCEGSCTRGVTVIFYSCRTVKQLFFWSPYQGGVVFSVSDPSHAVLNKLEAKLYKGTVWNKLLMQRYKKAKRIQWLPHCYKERNCYKDQNYRVRIECFLRDLCCFLRLFSVFIRLQPNRNKPDKNFIKKGERKCQF